MVNIFKTASTRIEIGCTNVRYAPLAILLAYSVATNCINALTVKPLGKYPTHPCAASNAQ